MTSMTNSPNVHTISCRGRCNVMIRDNVWSKSIRPCCRTPISGQKRCGFHIGLTKVSVADSPITYALQFDQKFDMQQAETLWRMKYQRSSNLKRQLEQVQENLLLCNETTKSLKEQHMTEKNRIISQADKNQRTQIAKILDRHQSEIQELKNQCTLAKQNIADQVKRSQQIIATNRVSKLNETISELKSNIKLLTDKVSELKQRALEMITKDLTKDDTLNELKKQNNALRVEVKELGEQMSDIVNMTKVKKYQKLQTELNVAKGIFNDWLTEIGSIIDMIDNQDLNLTDSQRLDDTDERLRALVDQFLQEVEESDQEI